MIMNDLLHANFRLLDPVAVLTVATSVTHKLW